MIAMDQTLDIKDAPIAVSTSGSQQIVAAVSGKRIALLAYTLIANGTVNVKWQKDSTDMTGLLYLIANVGASPAYCPVGMIKTGPSQALNLNLSDSVAVGGHVTYAVID